MAQLDKLYFIGELKIPPRSKGALLYMVCRPCVVRSARFASLRSEQGATAPCAAKAAIPTCLYKCGGGEIELVLDELGECVSDADSVEQKVEKKELVWTINTFLDTFSQEKCDIFICRYWYAIPVSETAIRFGMTEGNVSVTLNRIRGKLKNYLMERGYDL